MLAAAIIGVLFALTVAGLGCGSAVIARHRAQAAADLAALAGALAVPAGTNSACAQAQSLARAMHAAHVDCVTEDLDVIVTVDMALAFGSWAVGPARAAARAGPVSGGDP